MRTKMRTKRLMPLPLSNMGLSLGRSNMGEKFYRPKKKFRRFDKPTPEEVGKILSKMTFISRHGGVTIKVEERETGMERVNLN
jgi:hypothetical protein